MLEIWDNTVGNDLNRIKTSSFIQRVGWDKIINLDRLSRHNTTPQTGDNEDIYFINPESKSLYEVDEGDSYLDMEEINWDLRLPRGFLPTPTFLELFGNTSVGERRIYALFLRLKSCQINS